MAKNKSCGIYRITNNITKQVYIGSTVNRLANRLRAHRNQLEKSTHINKYLQNSWNKYGEANFSFDTLEWDVPKEQLYDRENYYMLEYGCFDFKRGFNVQPAPGGKWEPPKVSPEKGDSVAKHYVPEGYIITFPNGKEEKIINLTAFAKNNNLSEKCLFDCLVGRQSNHKGYKARYVNKSKNKDFISTFDEKVKEYVLYSPEGERFEVTNLRKWLIDRDFLEAYTGLVQCSSKTSSKKVYKGWQCYFKEDAPPNYINNRYLQPFTVYEVTDPNGSTLELNKKEIVKLLENTEEKVDNLIRKARQLSDTPTNLGWYCKIKKKL